MTATAPLVPLDQRPFLSVREAAALLGTDPNTVRRWVKAGHLDRWGKPGMQIRVTRASIDRLAAPPGTPPAAA